MPYKINKTDSSITTYSAERLNFEPKGWKKDFKKDLSNAITELLPSGKYLRSKLITTENDFFDVENILFYNVGPSKFKKFDTLGVWYQLERDDNKISEKYIHEYGFTDSIDEVKGEILAAWSDVLIDKPNTTRKPLDYWLALKKSKDIKISTKNYDGDFGMNIEISKPKDVEINIINIQKPLLDGIISAFHEISKTHDDVTNFISLKTNLSTDKVLTHINNNEFSILSKRDVIQKYVNGIKWNPQDEKCVDVRITGLDSGDDLFRISGCIFTV